MFKDRQHGLCDAWLGETTKNTLQGAPAFTQLLWRNFRLRPRPLPEKLILGSLCARTWIYLQYLDMAVAALPMGEETEQNEPATIDNDDQDDHYI